MSLYYESEQDMVNHRMESNVIDVKKDFERLRKTKKTKESSYEKRNQHYSYYHATMD